MTIAEVLKEWLLEHGYDGLFNSDGECACTLGDLGPCESWPEGCEPGYIATCPETCGEHDWHIQREKPEVADQALVQLARKRGACK